MRPLVRLTAFAALLTLGAAPAVSAHHSAAATYDAARSIAITGTVAAFTWRNPHSHLYLDVTDGPFAGKEYVIELSSPVVLAEQGWTRAMFKAGDRVTVHVQPSRAGAAAGLCRRCALAVNGVTKSLAVE